MKKMNYLLSVLLISFLFPLTGLFSSNVNEASANQQTVVSQNQPVLPDYASNKQVLNELKAVREMIMRSDNRVYRVKALRQMNDQLLDVLTGRKAEATTQPVVQTQNRQVNKTSGRTFLDVNAHQRKSDPKSTPTAQERRKVSFDGVMKYRLDSLVFHQKEGLEWLPQGKQEFAYNYNAQVTLTAGYDYDESASAWENDFKMTITYNDAGQPTMYLNQSWDGNLERWIDRYKQIIEYNAHGDVTLQAAYSEYYDQDSSAYVYRGEWKNEYGFDANNNEISSIYYSWDIENYDWIPDSKNEYYYENDMELMFAGYMWDRDKGKWIGHWKFEYEIVPGIDMLGSTYYHWDYEKDEWYIQEKTAYVLSTNEFGLVITETRWHTDYQTGQLVYEDRTVYSNPYGEIGHDLYASFRSIKNYQWSQEIDEWVNHSKTNNTFDTFGNITLRLDSVWSFTGDVHEWLIDFSIASNVNAQGKISDYVLTNWHYDGNNNSIYEKIRNLNTYNTKLELITQITQNWNFDYSVWVNSTKVEYAYDVSGRQNFQMFYDSYNPATSQWNPSRRIELDFNADGSQSLYASYDWIPPLMSWRLDYKYENVIDEFGVTVLESVTQWYGSLAMEIIPYRREKTFDERRNLTMESNIQSNIYWDGSKFTVYTEGSKTENVYDTSDRLISSIEFEYVTDNFVAYEKLEYTYNATYPMALETEIKYIWNDGWVKERKGVLTSDFDVTRNDLILPFGDPEGSREVTMYFSYKPMQLMEYIWSDEEDGQWVEDFKADLYYAQSEFSSVEEIKPGVVTVYPNPVSDFISVRFSETSTASFRIYDLQGRKLFDAPVNNHSKIDVSGFANGVYFYQITMGQETVSGKLLKK